MNKDCLICFDLDGVLINSMEIAIRVFKETMERELGLIYDFSSDKKMWALAPREKMDVLWGEEIKRRRITAGQIDQAMAVYQQAKMAADLPPFPYAVEAVKLMASRFSNIAVVSGNANAMIGESLRRIGILPFVKKIIGTDDVALAKPDPAMYQRAVSYFGVRSERTLTFEDSTFGIMAGKNAGIHVIGVATGVEDFADLKKTSADVILHNLSKLTLELALKTLQLL